MMKKLHYYKKKKIIRNRIIWDSYIFWGLYIYPVRVFPKKKKKDNKKVEFLKTDRYVIPIPSEELKEEEKTHFFCFGLNFLLIAVGIEFLILWKLTLFKGFLPGYYSPIGLSFVKKFSFVLKFDALKALKIFCWLVEEKSFYKMNYSWVYLTKRTLPFLEKNLYNGIFTIYKDPKKPLKKTWKPNPIGKSKGNALLIVKRIVFNEIVLEKRNIKPVYTHYDLDAFNWIGINPFDKRYYWPARRLFILNLSLSDGFILKDNQDYYFDKKGLSKFTFKVIDSEFYVYFFSQIFEWLEHLINLNKEGFFFKKINKNFFKTINFFDDFSSDSLSKIFIFSNTLVFSINQIYSNLDYLKEKFAPAGGFFINNCLNKIKLYFTNLSVVKPNWFLSSFFF